MYSVQTLTMKNSYTTKDENGYVSIYINNILHIKFQKADVLGVYSYISESDYYYIQITLRTMTSTMICEYTDKSVWVEVLKLLDDLLS